MSERRVAWADRDEPKFVDVPYWRVAGSWGTFGLVVGFLSCLMLLTCDARAGGPSEPEIPNCDAFKDDAEYEACRVYVDELLMQQQKQTALGPEQLAYPNQPTTIVLDDGSSIGEWAALIAGVASLIAALGGLEYRRRHRQGVP